MRTPCTSSSLPCCSCWTGAPGPVLPLLARPGALRLGMSSRALAGLAPSNKCTPPTSPCCPASVCLQVWQSVRRAGALCAAAAGLQAQRQEGGGAGGAAGVAAAAAHHARHGGSHRPPGCQAPRPAWPARRAGAAGCGSCGCIGGRPVGLFVEEGCMTWRQTHDTTLSAPLCTNRYSSRALSVTCFALPAPRSGACPPFMSSHGSIHLPSHISLYT